MKRGFNSTGEFRIACTSRWEFLWDIYERDIARILRISPCSAVCFIRDGESFGGGHGPSYDQSVPPIVITV